MSHLATPLGLQGTAKFEAAYWKVFRSFFGEQNSQMVKAMLLARVEAADTGEGEIDRVCFGLRQTMGWAADAIERRALAEIGAGGGSDKPSRPVVSDPLKGS